MRKPQLRSWLLVAACGLVLATAGAGLAGNDKSSAPGEKTAAQKAAAKKAGKKRASNYRIVGGTWFDRYYGLLGTAFAIDSRRASRLTVRVVGPKGWNAGETLTCGHYIPPGAATTRSICWTAVKPVNGLYKARPAPGWPVGWRRGAAIHITRTIAPPRIVACTASQKQVSLRWVTTTARTRSFLLRVNPLPWKGKITSERLLPAGARHAVLGHLRLVPGRRYQVTLFAFLADLHRRGQTFAPFDIGSDDVVLGARAPRC